MSLKRDSKGQLSVYDALIYFAFLLIATTILSFYSFEMEENREFVNDMNLTNYCEDTRSSVMRTTIDKTSYKNKTGVVIYRRNKTVESLMLEGLYLIEEGIKKENVEFFDDIDLLVSNLIRNDLEWLITAEYDGESIIISYKEISYSNIDNALNSIKGNLYSSSWREPMIKEKEGTVSFNFYISEKWD